MQEYVQDELSNWNVNQFYEYEQLPDLVNKNIQKLGKNAKQRITLSRKINDSYKRNGGELPLKDIKSISKELYENDPRMSESTYGAAIAAGTTYKAGLSASGQIPRLTQLGQNIYQGMSNQLGFTGPAGGEVAAVGEGGAVIGGEVAAVGEGGAVIGGEVAAVGLTETAIVTEGITASVAEAIGISVAPQIVIPAIIVGATVKFVWDLID